MSDAAPIRRNSSSLWVMVRGRLVQFRNVVDQQLREAPLRTLAVLGLLGVIWSALYFVLTLVLKHVRKWELVGIVADRYIYVHFFLVLAVMLAFSNGILTFSSLYGRREASYLLSMPVHARQVVFVKWLEGIFLSSWSFLLLGVPLMLAVAANSEVEWYYYPLFLAHFVGFVAMPACLGLLAAWAVAMFFPRRPLVTVIAIAFVLALLSVLWFMNISRHAVESERWLTEVFQQISLSKQPWLPSTWTANGIVLAVERRVDASLFYLMVVLGNASFFAWLTINVLGRTWPDAYSRAQQGRYHPTIRRDWFTTTACNVLFFYLPEQLRKVMLKDLRGFVRDATQWTQMAIMFGLLVVYVLNLSRLPLNLQNPHMKGLVAALNLTTVSLILATFTSRFIYPLLSLESQQLWLLEMLPVRRLTLLLVKFLFALTVTGLSAGGVMWLAATVLELPLIWARANVAMAIAMCIGLSGLAIGLGARFPVLGQRNPARIASGFGGTFNLIASMLFVVTEMGGFGWLLFTELKGASGLPTELTLMSSLLLAGLLLLSVLIAALALWEGARHFERLEV